MIISYRFLFLLLINLSIASVVSGQQSATINNITKNKAPGNFVFNEAIVIITDSKLYIPGETIYCSFFSIERELSIISSLSSVVYVELLSQNKEIVAQVKASMHQGIGEARIRIPGDLDSDYYYLRAYSNYMKNFGPDFFGVKRLAVVNPFTHNTERFANAAADDIIIKFYPESGDLIQGMPIRVVYTWNDDADNTFNLPGIITDSLGTEVATTRFLCKGMGYFDIIPTQKKSYFFHSKFNNKPLKLKLPKVLDEGGIIQFDSISGAHIYLSVKTSSRNQMPLQLKVEQAGINYTVLNAITSEDIQVKIPLASLPDGMVHFKLVDLNKKQLGNRFIYLAANKVINSQIKLTSDKYQSRDSVFVNVNTNLSNKQPVSASICAWISVSSANKQKTLPDLLKLEALSAYLPHLDREKLSLLINDQNILQQLLISAYYKAPVKPIQMKYIPEPKGDIISGHVVDILTGEPSNKVRVIQTTIDSIAWIKSFYTDNMGSFKLYIDKNCNWSELVFRVMDTASSFAVKLQDEFFKEYQTFPYRKLQLNKNELDQIRTKMINSQVSDAFSYKYPQQMSQPLNNYDKFAFYGEPSKVYHIKDYVKLSSLEEFLYEIVKGVMVRKSKSNKEILISSIDHDGPVGDDPLLIVDGLPLYNADDLLAINISLIKTIKVYQHKLYHNGFFYEGILDIITKDGDFSKIKLPENTSVYNFVPIQESAPNMHPLKNKNLAERIPYYFSVPYFNNKISSNEHGEAKFSFIAPDNAGMFTISVFTVAADGFCGYVDKNIKILSSQVQ